MLGDITFYHNFVESDDSVGYAHVQLNDETIIVWIDSEKKIVSARDTKTDKVWMRGVGTMEHWVDAFLQNQENNVKY